MQQVLQNIKTGETTLETVPPPALHPGGVRVRTAVSLISAGTETMRIDLAQKMRCIAGERTRRSFKR